MKTYSELEDMNFVFIDNDFFTDKYISTYGIESALILAIIQRNLLIRGQYIFSFNNLFDCLGIKSTNSIHRKKIKNILIQMQKDNIIVSDTDLSSGNNSQFIFIDIKLKDEDYTIIYDFELDSILNYQNENTYNLFNAFVFLKYRSGVKKYCYWSQDDIATSIGLKTRQVVSSLIDILDKELDLILVAEGDTRILKNGTIQESNNMYSMNYEGHQEILKIKKEEYNQQLLDEGVKTYTSKKANSKRSLKQKINHLNKKVEDGTITNDELDLFDKLNEEYDLLSGKETDKQEPENKRDFKDLKLPFEGEEEQQDKKISIGRKAKSFAEESKIDKSYTSFLYEEPKQKKTKEKEPSQAIKRANEWASSFEANKVINTDTDFDFDEFFSNYK